MTQKYEHVNWEKGRDGKNGKEPHFPPVLFSCLRFQISADSTISETETGSQELE